MLKLIWPLSKSLLFLKILIAAGIAAANFSCQNSSSSFADFPEPNFSGTEKQVVEKIMKLRSTVEKNPDLGSAWGKLGMNFDVHDFQREAIFCYERATALDSADFRWPYFYALLLNEVGDQNAFAWFERCREMDPDYLPLLAHLGEASLNRGKMAEAAAAFERALSLNSNSIYARIGLSRIALREGKAELSRQHLITATEIDTLSREVYGLLAETYRRLGRGAEAEDAQKRAQALPMVTEIQDSVRDELAAEGESAYWYRIRGDKLLSQGEFEKAAHQFEKALVFKPSRSGSVFLADLFEKAANFSKAKEHFLAAIRLNPSDADLYVSLGKTLSKLGDFKGAIDWTNSGLRMNPRHPDLYENLANFHLAIGHPKDAIAAYQDGLRFTGGNIFLATRFGWLLASGTDANYRDGAKAVEILERVCEKINFQSPEPIDALAAAYAESGDFGRAVEFANRARKQAIALEGRELAADIEKRIALYKSGKAYRISEER